jgi:hypothetical protein
MPRAEKEEIRMEKYIPLPLGHLEIRVDRRPPKPPRPRKTR